MKLKLTAKFIFFVFVTGRIEEHGMSEERERIVYSADEQISLVLELSKE